MSNSNTRPYAHFWVERSYGHYSLKEQLEMVEAKNKQLKKVIEDFDNKRAGTMIERQFVDLDLVLKFQVDSKQLERSEKENEKLREACEAALDYLQLPELTWKENLIDILTEFLTCCKD